MVKQSLLFSWIIFFFTTFEAQAQREVQVWTSNGANKIQQLVDGTAFELITDGIITPWGIAVDQSAGKLYWSNVTEGTISRADLNGENIETILSGLDLPRGIALDESANILFWAEGGSTSPGIKSVILSEDPLEETEIATSAVVSPYHITVDAEEQFVYWVDNASTVKQINRAKYNGSGVETIITDVYVKQVAGLTLDATGSTLYWGDFEDDLMYSADAASEDQNVQIVYEISGESTPWALDVDSESETLYWTDYLNSSIHQIHLNTSDQAEIASGISTPSGFVSYSEKEVTPGSPDNFITTWKTDNEGSSNDEQVMISTEGGGYNYDVYWEEVNNASNNGSELYSRGDLTLTFPSAGTYRVEIAGNFPRIFLNGEGDSDKLLTIEQWGSIAWASMTDAFRGASNLTYNAEDAPDLTEVADVSGAFREAVLFNGNLSNWDVSSVADMTATFMDAASFDQDLGSWDISSVSTMENMLSNTNLSVENYDKTLIGWEAQVVQTNVRLDANGLQYCQGGGADARQALIDENNWMIVDAGVAADCIPTNLDDDGSLPVDFSLGQNYPNPFNPTTLIRFDLPASGHAQLVIYDLTGRTIQTLLDGNLTAGSHQVLFDGSRLSSGVYLYRLETVGYRSTRKMMLVK